MIDRKQEIEIFVNTKTKCSLNDICSKCNISMSTARRYIDTLAREGKLKKVYGGVISNLDHSAPNNIIIPYSTRNQLNLSEKQGIAESCIQLIDDYDVIFLDSGSTTIKIIPLLAHYKQLTVVTCCLPHINELVKLDNIKLIIPPGPFDKNMMSVFGVATEKFLSEFNFTKSFIATAGITKNFYLTNSTMEECSTKLCAIKHTSQNILVADNSKFGKNSAVSFTTLDSIQTIVCNSKPSYEYENYCVEHNIKIIVSE